MSVGEPLNVGILLISTRRYKQFVPQLLDSLHRNFLLRHKLHVFLFTDEKMDLQNNGMTIEQIIIPAYGFPAATLLRFHIFTQRTYEECDYLYYIDVDCRAVSEIGEEILGDIVAVLHPGFSMFPGYGSWETREISASYVPLEKRKFYAAGGFNGGATTSFYKAMQIMKGWIDEDEAIGITPIWHDETALNKLLSEMDYSEITMLDSSYMMPEQNHLRIAWKIDNLKPRILALDKVHAEIRS